MDNPKNRKIRAALYARVSTSDKNQNPETQLKQLREYSKRRKFLITQEYIDYGSGTNGDRVRLKQLMQEARKRKFEVLIVWKYDRFARSVSMHVKSLDEFNSLGIDFISLQEGTDTTTPQGKLFFHMAAGFAEFESSLIGSRVKAGMELARSKGKQIGRTPVSPADIKKIKELRRKKMSLNEISQRLDIPRSTVHKYSR